MSLDFVSTLLMQPLPNCGNVAFERCCSAAFAEIGCDDNADDGLALRAGATGESAGLKSHEPDTALGLLCRRKLQATFFVHPAVMRLRLTSAGRQNRGRQMWLFMS